MVSEEKIVPLGFRIFIPRLVMSFVCDLIRALSIKTWFCLISIRESSCQRPRTHGTGF